MLVGTDVWVPVVFVWEETGVPGGNPPVWLGDHMTISHADAGNWAWVAAMRGERVTTTPARQLKRVICTWIGEGTYSTFIPINLMINAWMCYLIQNN